MPLPRGSGQRGAVGITRRWTGRSQEVPHSSPHTTPLLDAAMDHRWAEGPKSGLPGYGARPHQTGQAGRTTDYDARTTHGAAFRIARRGTVAGSVNRRIARGTGRA